MKKFIIGILIVIALIIAIKFIYKKRLKSKISANTISAIGIDSLNKMSISDLKKLYDAQQAVLKNPSALS